jgi:hypothetical protein
MRHSVYELYATGNQLQALVKSDNGRCSRTCLKDSHFSARKRGKMYVKEGILEFQI